MDMYKWLGLSVSALIVAALMGVGNVTGAAAASGCEEALYTGTASVDEGTYDVYVKLGRRGQSATVQLYSEGAINDTRCRQVGQINASGDEWLKIGTWTSDSSDQLSFGMNGSSLQREITANRPAIMLIDHNNPLCTPIVECATTIDGSEGYIVPVESLGDDSTLRVLQPRSIEGDTLKSVAYYVDDSLMYTTKKLEPFDMRYASLPGQVLRRVAEYRSGQRVIYEEKVPGNFVDSLGNFIFRVFHTDSRVVQALLWILGATIIWAILYGVWSIINRRRIWRIHHGFIAQKSHIVSDTERAVIFKRQRVLNIIRKVMKIFLGILLAGACVMFVTTYILKISRVDGVSMQTSYHTDELLWVNSIPVSWGRLSEHYYIPKRGDVVIIRAVYGVTENNTDIQSKPILIKRVLGLPGERVTINNGTVMVYKKDSAGIEGIQPDKGAPWESKMIRDDASRAQIDLTLGPTELFVSGDNRPESTDSRTNGPIDVRQIVGVVVGPINPFQK